MKNGRSRMGDIMKLSAIRGSELPLLAELLNAESGKRTIDKDRIDQWSRMEPSQRARDMQVYFDLLSGAGFSKDVLRTAVRKIRARRRKRTIVYSFRMLLLASCMLLAWKWWAFSKLPRVYTIGRDITVRLSDASLRDFSFLDGATESLLEKGVQGDSIQVCADSFVDWLIEKSPTGKVSVVDFVRSSDSINKFMSIFAEMEEIPYFNECNSAKRRKIFDILQMDPDRTPLRIIAKSNLAKKDSAFALPFILYSPKPEWNLNESLFVTVACSDGEHNLKYTLKKDGTLEDVKPLVLHGAKLIRGRLRWIKTQDEVPELYFTNGKSYYKLDRPDALKAEEINPPPH